MDGRVISPISLSLHLHCASRILSSTFKLQREPPDARESWEFWVMPIKVMHFAFASRFCSDRSLEPTFPSLSHVLCLELLAQYTLTSSHEHQLRILQTRFVTSLDMRIDTQAGKTEFKQPHFPISTGTCQLIKSNTVVRFARAH